MMASEKTSVVKRCPSCGRTYSLNEGHLCPNTPQQDGADPGSSFPSQPELGDPLIGATLGDRYAIQDRLGRGGMGLVYRAQHIVLGRIVAVKILLKRQDADAQARFLQEAKLASTLNHPNIVYISDFGVLDDSRPYLVMEYLQGPTLAKELRSGRLSPVRACQIALQLADGLQVVHDKGIIHRGVWNRSNRRKTLRN